MMHWRSSQIGLLAIVLVGCTPRSDTTAVTTPNGSARLSPAVERELRRVLEDTTTTAGLPVAGLLLEASSRIVQLGARLATHYDGARTAADSAAAGIGFMLGQWTPDAAVPADYRHDLARGVRILRLAEEAPDPADAHLLWSAVVEDMEVKIEHCYALGTGLGGLIAVRAHTLRAMAVDSGWQVVYLPKIFEVLPDAQPLAFPRLSSPAEDSLAPGRYWIWARRPGTPDLGERVLLRVGGGRSEVEVDLPLPVDGVR